MFLIDVKISSNALDMPIFGRDLRTFTAKFIMPVLLGIFNGNELKLCLCFKFFILKMKVVLALLVFISQQVTDFNSSL